MRAVIQKQYGDVNVLQMDDVVMPIRQSGEVLIRAVWTGVNFTDIKQRRGGKATGTFPFVLGVDVSGIVVDADPSSAIKVGDRVMAFVLDGSYKEVVRADERLVYSLPETISLRDAAAGMLTSILSEILLTQIAQVKLKDTIVIHSAAGGVGSMLIQLARLKGMTRLIATVGHADKIPYVRALGI
ncbi:alcohol dehydrogenase catalytic domain-containing protein [Exiguobacterium indicum]